MHLSADFSTLLDEILLAPLYPGIESVQGIAFDGSLWFADMAGKKIRHISTAGVPLSGDITLAYIPNGLAIDRTAGALWINADVTDPSPNTIEKRSAADGSLIASLSISLANHDQLHYDDATRQLYYSHGANGAAGKVNIYEASGNTLTLLSTVNLSAEADAIEGIYVDGPRLRVTNDGFFHAGVPALNRVLTYQ